MRFPHPRTILPPEKVLPYDYDVGIIDYPVDEKRPISAWLYVAPLHKAQGFPKQREECSSYCYTFKGLKKIPDIAIHS